MMPMEYLSTSGHLARDRSDCYSFSLLASKAAWDITEAALQPPTRSLGGCTCPDLTQWRLNGGDWGRALLSISQQSQDQEGMRLGRSPVTHWPQWVGSGWLGSLLPSPHQLSSLPPPTLSSSLNSLPLYKRRAQEAGGTCPRPQGRPTCSAPASDTQQGGKDRGMVWAHILGGGGVCSGRHLATLRRGWTTLPALVLVLSTLTCQQSSHPLSEPQGPIWGGSVGGLVL